VTEPSGPDFNVNESTVADFAAHLEAFAGTLSDPDRALLQRLLASLLDPWERMRLRDPGEILSTDEAEMLRELERKIAP
jgi:hypothetical protein